MVLIMITSNSLKIDDFVDVPKQVNTIIDLYDLAWDLKFLEKTNENRTDMDKPLFILSTIFDEPSLEVLVYIPYEGTILVGKDFLSYTKSVYGLDYKMTQDLLERKNKDLEILIYHLKRAKLK